MTRMQTSRGNWSGVIQSRCGCVGVWVCGCVKVRWAERERQRKADKIGVGVGIGIGVANEIGVAFGHEKLGRYS